jgi:hypothetical protein
MPLSDTERTADPKADCQQLGLIAFPALDQIAGLVKQRSKTFGCLLTGVLLYQPLFGRSADVEVSAAVGRTGHAHRDHGWIEVHRSRPHNGAHESLSVTWTCPRHHHPG